MHLIYLWQQLKKKRIAFSSHSAPVRVHLACCFYSYLPSLRLHIYSGLCSRTKRCFSYFSVNILWKTCLGGVIRTCCVLLTNYKQAVADTCQSCRGEKLHIEPVCRRIDVWPELVWQWWWATEQHCSLYMIYY